MEASNKKRVWLISELYYPEVTSTGHYLTNIAEGLSDQYDVRVICNQPSYAARGIKAPQKEARNGVGIERCDSLVLNKNNFLLRLVNLFSISLNIFFKAYRRLDKGDIVLVVTNPPLLPFLIQFASRLKRASCALLIHDIYPDTMVAAGILKEDVLITRMLRALNNYLYRKVDSIGVLGRDMEDLVKKKLGNGNSDCVFITRCWADVGEVFPVSGETNPLMDELSISNKFIVQYAGNMGRVQDVENVVEAAKILDFEANIHFMFIGTGAKKDWVADRIDEYGLRNCSLLDPMPRSEQQVFLNACDAAVVALVPKMLGIAVPSRMYNIMASGKPIVAAVHEESELARVIKEEEIGWVVPVGQPDNLAEAIFNASLNKKVIAKMGDRARAVAEKRYSFQTVIKDYQSLIEAHC